MPMPVRMYPRENRKRYSNRRSVQQCQKEQSSSPVSPPVLRRSEDVDDATTVTKGVEGNTFFETTSHCMHIFSNNMAIQ